MADEPSKFITEAGVRKLNPAWKAWKAAHDGGAAAAAAPDAVVCVAPPMLNAATALPVVCSVAEQQQHLTGAQAAPAYAASLAQSMDAASAQLVGVAPEQMMDRLARVFAKYEVPMGLLSKLQGLSNFQRMEMIVDDSGSMGCEADARDTNGKKMTRWQEVHQRLQQMFELYAYVPAPPCTIRFLNRSDVIEVQHAPGQPPEAFLAKTLQDIARSFTRGPSGSTPAQARIAESLARYGGQATLRYFFGDGVPDGGEEAQEAITKLLVKRANPERNPFTFLSCTNEDAAVEWMKEAEEKAAYCAEFDDFADEAGEILKDQGKAFPYTFGMHLVGQLVAAFNPDDLDAMDESAPFTKQTLDSLQGYQCSAQEYDYYFNSFLEAQNARKCETKLDNIKKSYQASWRANREAFRTARIARDIPIVQDYHRRIASESAPGCCVVA